MGLKVNGRQSFNGGSLGCIDMAQRDQVIGQGARFRACPFMECSDELCLLDQAGLEGKQTEE